MSAIFWTCRDSERLTCESVDEAVEEYLDAVPMYEWPETLTVRGFEPQAATYDGDTVLERMLEHLDEEYGDPDGDPTEPTEEMKAAADAFVTVVLAGYRSWACEECETVDVNVREWVKENRPDRLEEAPKP